MSQVKAVTGAVSDDKGTPLSGAGFESASWSGDNVISAAIFKSGNASVGKPFSKG